MRPEDYQPPISWWGHAYRLGLVLAVSAMVWGTRASHQFDQVRWWFFVDLAVGLACCIAVWWRRTHPVVVATATNLAGLISLSSAGPAMLAMVSLCTRRRWVEIIPQALLAFAVAVFTERYFRQPELPPFTLVDLGMIAVLICLMVALGMYIGSRRELLASWQARARLAEAQQHAKVGEARSAERARIAREMHDVLAHRISTVNMHAGALTYRDDLTPEQLRETAGVIAETSRQALTELREVLGVLREGPGDAAPEQPQAAMDLRELVEENRRTGMRIEYDAELTPAELPAGLARTLYRCLQEGLTNARKHAPTAVVRVRVTGEPQEGVNLRVRNGLSPRSAVAVDPPASGFGLVGLAERVELSGGRQSAGVGADGIFALNVWLPWHL
ncbi:sensor histidine kinase [Gordonia caeni]|uniref:histidine kinase n=1 Tax=Gordonia caeni TaxID=1007097 RepID=A0ABP7P1P2_9ACTN